MMEVDNMDSTMDNSSLPNNTIENDSIGDSKDFDSVSNVSNSDTDTLKNPEVTPNGEAESLSPEPNEHQPLHNASIETHLESNLNVIENQNNENLERDNELIENESLEVPEPRSTTSEIQNTSELSLPNNSNTSNDNDSSELLSDSLTNAQLQSDMGCELTPTQESVEDSVLDKSASDKTDKDKEDVEECNSGEESELSMLEHDKSVSVENKSKSVDTSEIHSETNIELEKANENVTNISADIDSEKIVIEQSSSKNNLECSENQITVSDESNTTTELCNASTVEKEILPPETNSISTQNNPISEESTNCEQRIEFAQVDFDSNIQENEKGNDKSVNKGSELDPIASSSDVLASLENCQGADEEITIIPDSEREITEAEKEAASSLPTLKDISQKRKLPDPVNEEPVFKESEINIYKYDKSDLKICSECNLERAVKYHFTNQDQHVKYICDDNCLDYLKSHTNKKMTMAPDDGGGLRVKNFTEGPPEKTTSLAFVRKCASCKKITDDLEVNLTWEIMDFCNELCLSKYQKMIGSKCASCAGDVKSASLGKYCVRFGNDIRQFCTSTCLEQYKKGLKVCSYCQQDMSNGPDGFLAPVGEKGQFKDFCSKVCMEKYDIMTNDRPPNVKPGTSCSVCKTEKPITIEFEHENFPNYFCGEPCFVAFSFVNKINPGKCAMCRRQFNMSILEKHTMYYDNVQYSFCSNSCENIYIIAHRKIVPCSWCKVKKYNFDMIKKYSKSAPVINMCSINCLSLYQVSINAVNSKPTACHYCQKSAHPAYHLTMSDATMRNFCSYACVMNFQNQFPKQITLNNISDPIPTGTPQKTKKFGSPPESVTPTTNETITQLPVISSVQSLANTNGTSTPPLLPPGLTPISSTRLTRSKTTTSGAIQQSPVQTVQNIELPVQVQVKQHYILRDKPCAEQRNVAVMCAPRKAVRATQVSPTMVDVGIQTDREEIKKILIPVPVPIYVPAPCHMFAAPVPIPVPFPLPIPIPIFIPTTRNSSAGIMKEIKKIQVKIPTDPYEAELLMMAEMVAEEKKEENTDSESDIDDNGAADGAGEYSPEPVDASNTFGDDMLQMALKMATELEEPAVDLEGALTANTITAPQGSHPEGHPQEEGVDDSQPLHHHIMERSSLRGRKRGMRGSPRGGQSKRGRRMSHHQVDLPLMPPVQPAAPPEPQEKPDANMCLKYTFGVNAWKQWVTTKNTELEKSSRLVKLFKTEILQLTADELNYSLCLFVKEVRKPNGQEYAPDTIYYLCLGIQQYLFENGRIDNIFCDVYYEKFTDCLDEVAKKFSVLYNDSHYIVTRVEEEHLWESKQLGAHSPHVLLSTLMFFNTKHFNLTSVDEHMQLSFSHIMKHWKRNPNQPGASKVPGSRNVLLRFYPPQSALQNNQRKKKVYEQQENEENPLRCPVKLYEFYLSKCPESVKTRNDVFYLQPERSCVPDSPVWYSTMPLPKEALEKMLHRVKMVKEINVALLTS